METSDYLGGRIRSLDFNGRVVEEGPNWITGTIGKNSENGGAPLINPVYELAQNVKLETEVLTTEVEPAFDAVENGKNITKKNVGKTKTLKINDLFRNQR